MVEHDMHVGELLKLLDDLGIADNTIVFYSTDNGPHYNTWPDAGTTMFRSEKNSNWEGAYRVPAFVRWPGQFPARTTLNGIVSHEDWLPTFAAAAGDAGIKDRLLTGAWSSMAAPTRTTSTATTMLDYLSGKVKDSPRKEFMYVNDDGQIVAIRYDGWKAVFLENRGQAFGVWREPFTELRVPLLFNVRRDPFETRPAQREHLQRLVPRPGLCAGADAGHGCALPRDDEGLSAEPDAGLVQSGEGPKADRSRGAWRMMLIIPGCCCRSRRCSRLTSAGGADS